MDITYDLPYTRTYHPIYEAKGGIPAIKEVRFSITSHRGCFGSCSFCALTFHQGRVIQNRSQESIIDEANCLQPSLISKDIFMISADQLLTSDIEHVRNKKYMVLVKQNNVCSQNLVKI